MTALSYCYVETAHDPASWWAIDIGEAPTLRGALDTMAADTRAGLLWRVTTSRRVRLYRDGVEMPRPEWRYSDEAYRWSLRHDWVTAWQTCTDARWMLHAAARVADRPRIVLAACACARTVLDRVPAGEDRPRVAIETAERWARGEATTEDVRRAAREARSYAAAYATAYATATAATVADAYAAYAAAAAVAAAAAAADAQRASSRAKHLATLADVVREAIPLDKVLDALTQRAQVAA